MSDTTTTDPFALARNGGDQEIVNLLHEWQAAHREADRLDGNDEAEQLAADERVWAIERQIYDAPVAGPIGLAVKAYLAARYSDACGEHGRDLFVIGPHDDDLFAPDGSLRLDLHCCKALMTAAAAFLPELAALAGPVIAMPAKAPRPSERVPTEAQP